MGKRTHLMVDPSMTIYQMKEALVAQEPSLTLEALRLTLTPTPTLTIIITLTLTLTLEALRLAVGSCPVGYGDFHGRYNPSEDHATTVGGLGLVAGIEIGLTTVATPMMNLD